MRASYSLRLICFTNIKGNVFVGPTRWMAGYENCTFQGQIRRFCSPHRARVQAKVVEAVKLPAAPRARLQACPTSCYVFLIDHAYVMRP